MRSWMSASTKTPCIFTLWVFFRKIAKKKKNAFFGRIHHCVENCRCETYHLIRFSLSFVAFVYHIKSTERQYLAAPLEAFLLVLLLVSTSLSFFLPFFFFFFAMFAVFFFFFGLFFFIFPYPLGSSLFLWITHTPAFKYSHGR